MSNISIGNNKPRGRNSVLKPENTGMTKIAQRRLDQAVGQAVVKHENSLAVDGIHVLIWNKTRAGNLCSCTTKETYNDEVDTSGVLVEEINQPDTSVTIGLTAVDDRLLDQPTLPTTASLGITIRGPDGTEYESSGGSVSEASPIDKKDFRDLDTSIETGLKGDEDYCDDEEVEISDIEINELDELYNTGASDPLAGLFGGRSTGCVICLDNQWTESYQLVAGTRIVLDATRSPVGNGFVEDLDTYPTSYSTVPNSGATLSWSITLPKYFLEAIGINVQNNAEVLHTSKVKVYSDINGVETEITLEYLNTHVKDKLALDNVYIKPNPDSPDEVLIVTHVEIVYQLLNWPYAGLANMESTLSLNDGFEVIQTADFELGGSVPLVTRESIIQELRTGSLFKVETVTTKQTASNQVFGYEVSGRRVATSSLFHNLKQYGNHRIINRNHTYLDQYQGLDGSKAQKV